MRFANASIFLNEQMISKTYYRYIWLLDTLLTSAPLTFEEINKLWEDCPASDGPIPLRTFHEHRKGIKEMFGINIECDRSKNVYFVKNPEAIDENKLSKWLLEKYSIPKDFATFNGLKDRVLLEEIPLGQAFLPPIMEAMMHHLELMIGYQQFKVEQRQEFHMQPYALKVFNRRWYLLGYVKEREEVRHLALDRMLDVNVTRKHFTMPEDFDAKKYYANTIGVYVDHQLPIKEVKIRAYGTQVEYLRSLPLHQSQKEGRAKYGEFAEFIYRVRITPELITQLLAMGDKVEVLEPESLREEMKERINNMYNFYK